MQFYNDAKDALLNLRQDVTTRMLNCMKILEEAGNKGVLQVRALETMKKTRAVNPSKPGQPKKTGVTVPDTVSGQPVAAGVGIQKHSDIAAHLKNVQAEYDAKFRFKCPLEACGQRCASEGGLKMHWGSKHKGLPFPAAQVQMPMPATATAQAVVASSCAGEDQSNTAAAAPPAAAVSPQPQQLNKRTKKVHDESAYETCSVCPTSRYLKHNRGAHLTSAIHIANASAAKK